MSQITNATWNNMCSCLDIHNTPIRVSRASLLKALGFYVDGHVAWMLLSHISIVYLLSGETYSFAGKKNFQRQIWIAGCRETFAVIKSFCLSPSEIDFFFIYICCSVHRNSRLKKFNKMQQYADIYLLLNYSACFGPPSHPSSGVYKTVVSASGTDHTIWKLAPQISWSVPEAAATVLCALDDGCDGRPKHVE